LPGANSGHHRTQNGENESFETRLKEYLNDVISKNNNIIPHLFQTSMNEYATIEQTIDPVLLAEISGWVLKQTK